MNVRRVLVPRYRAVRTVPSLKESNYGSEVEQTKTFSSPVRAWEWCAWGWILMAREQCCEDGRYGRCVGTTTESTLTGCFCRYHNSDRCRIVVRRLARLMRRWSSVPLSRSA